MKNASTILQQLGGNKFIAMTGAKCFHDNNGNTLVIKFPGSKVANHLTITLNGMDTYDLTFSKYRSMAIKTVKQFDGAYADMLKNIFESTTGLRTSL